MIQRKGAMSRRCKEFLPASFTSLRLGAFAFYYPETLIAGICIYPEATFDQGIEVWK